MKHLLIELCLYILCATLYIVNNAATTQCVYLLLISFCAIALPDSIGGLAQFEKKAVKIHIVIILCLGMMPTLFFPSMLLLLPVLMLNIRRYNILGTYVVYIACMIYGSYYHPEVCAIGWILSVIAIFIEDLLIQNENFHNTLIITRDNSKEYALLLEEKNRTLMENQDANVLSATLSERNRIAREIHDNVGHMLTRSLLQIGALKAINQDDKMKQPLENLHSTLDLAMNNIRTSVHDLHDESINFETALNDILQTADKFDKKLDLDNANSLPRQLKYAFIAIAKEAVNNTIKHSDGNQIEITLRDHPGFYQFMINDNGSSTNIDFTSGIGIGNIEDRVKQINGNVVINTNKGFTILVTVLKK